jgi:endonuclease G
MQRLFQTLASAAFAAICFTGFAQQTPDEAVQAYERELSQLESSADSLRVLIEAAKLADVRLRLKAAGFPSEDAVLHQGMVLSYAEAHEQAKWVMHLVLPDIIDGKVSRTNDFREDPKVSTGTAVEADYFLKSKDADGEWVYDGFGYDRGHLAPSADFRWSPTALSESYYYSNMSPQVADFNRGAWAELEDAIRAYIYRNPQRALYVVTLPLLTDDLPVIQRGVNQVSIPQYFYKVVLDKEAGEGIAFKMPNRKIEAPLQSFALSIDAAEQETGYDFFPLFEDAVKTAEAAFSIENWFTDEQLGDVAPLDPTQLPPGHFNTMQARQYIGERKPITVCGTVVGTRTSRSGNVWINLDRQYPNQIFSVYIKKEHLVNFGYDPEQALVNQEVCIKGRVMDLGGTPTMRIEREKEVEVQD